MVGQLLCLKQRRARKWVFRFTDANSIESYFENIFEKCKYRSISLFLGLRKNVWLGSTSSISILKTKFIEDLVKHPIERICQRLNPPILAPAPCRLTIYENKWYSMILTNCDEDAVENFTNWLTSNLPQECL